MHRPHAHHAAFVFQSQSFSDIDGVVVAVPDVDILRSEFLRHSFRMQLPDAEGEAAGILKNIESSTVHPNSAGVLDKQIFISDNIQK